jgi:hypothetical protein
MLQRHHESELIHLLGQELDDYSAAIDGSRVGDMGETAMELLPFHGLASEERIHLTEVLDLFFDGHLGPPDIARP